MGPQVEDQMMCTSSKSLNGGRKKENIEIEETEQR